MIPVSIYPRPSVTHADFSDSLSSMRIAFVSTLDLEPWGGSEELWSQTAARLAGQGHQVSASVAHQPQLSPKLRQLETAGVPVTVRPPPHVGILRRVARKLVPYQPWKAALAHLAPDLVVISQCGFTDGLDCMRFCREQRLPYVTIVQLNAEVFWPSDLVRDDMLEVYPAARKVCCVSRHNLDLLQRQLGQSLPHGQVVQNPFNISADRPLTWPASDPVWKLACVARLDPRAKGQDLLLSIFSRPAWRVRPVELNLYGAGLWERGLRQLAQRFELKNVHFRGHVGDIDELWAQNQLLVLPSRYEGMPLALIESMWRARPAVVTDVGGNADLCVDNQTGFVAPAATKPLVAEALERAWTRRDDWESMGLAARARAEQIISRDPVADLARELIEIASPEATTQKASGLPE